MYKVVIIGSGNVATRLAAAMKTTTFSLLQIYSRNSENAKLLADTLDCKYISDIQDITSDADLYIFAVKDDALQSVISAMRPNKGLWLHTAGSIPLNIFDGFAERYGVLYPLQTLSKQREVDFKSIPLCIEGNTEITEDEIFTIASHISDEVYRISSDKRRYIHLAAVFANNFSNHLFDIAARMFEAHGMDFRMLLPLINETASKLNDMTPTEAQTGPAVRNDINVIDRHLALLKDDDLRDIYIRLSENIRKFNKK